MPARPPAAGRDRACGTRWGMREDARVRRLLRYGLIWLICTTCTVTVGFLAVGFVMDEAGGTPPTVQADGATGGGPSVSASPSAVTSVPASPSASTASASPG